MVCKDLMHPIQADAHYHDWSTFNLGFLGDRSRDRTNIICTMSKLPTVGTTSNAHLSFLSTAFGSICYLVTIFSDRTWNTALVLSKAVVKVAKAAQPSFEETHHVLQTFYRLSDGGYLASND